MPAATQFQELICRVRAGDEQAAAELVRVYEPHIRRAVRVRLRDRTLRRVVDSMDICQSVLRRFFARATTGQLQLDTPRQLVGLLVVMAENRVRDWQRRQLALRRDQRRAVLLSTLAGELAAPSAPAHSAPECDAKAVLEQVLSRLSPDERRLAEQRRDGASWSAIASCEKRSPDALRMQLRRAIDRALHELREAPDDRS